MGAIYVTTEKNGKWGKPERLPGSAALPDIVRTVMSCGAPRGCTVGGYYSTKVANKPWVDTQRNGTWGKPETVPGIQP